MNRPDNEVEVLEARDVGYLLFIIPLLLAVIGLALDFAAGRVA